MKDDKKDATCGRQGRKETCVQGFVEKREGKRPYGKRRRIWEGNTKVCLENVTE
jgi:hypothetical protein